MSKPPKEKLVKNRCNVIYQPRAGRAKTLRLKIPADGKVSINGGTHVIHAQSMGIWKGKNPWVRINQEAVQALPWFGGIEALSPEQYNESVENHYAKECIDALDTIDNKKESPTTLYILLGIVLLAQIVLGIWGVMATGNLEDAIAWSLAHQAQAGAPAGVVDSAQAAT